MRDYQRDQERLAREELEGIERVRKAVEKLNDTAKRTWPPPIVMYDKWSNR